MRLRLLGAMAATLMFVGAASAQDEDFIPLVTVTPSVQAPDGAWNVPIGPVLVTMRGQSGDSIGALFLWPAAFVGDFQFDLGGLLMIDYLDRYTRLNQTLILPPELAGLLISAVPYSTDGVMIHAGDVRTFRIN